jgi:hypothetical protein
MGVAPLDPSRCYVIAHAGPAAEEERRAFEVRDFTSNTERTSVFVIGRAYDAPSRAMHPIVVDENPGRSADRRS